MFFPQENKIKSRKMYVLCSVLLVLFFGFLVFKNEAKAQFKPPYDFSEPEKTLTLSIDLKEISGLSLTPKKSQLAAIGDEKGQIFFINIENGKIERAPIFREKGDFEDLVMLSDSVWCVKSDGDLYKITDLDQTTPTSEKYKSGFLSSERDDVEGLCFDEKNNRLLLACKGVTDSFNVRRFMVFDLKTNKFDEKPAFSLDPCDVEKMIAGGKKGKPFSPSGIAIHPKTGDFYVISSVGKVLAVLSSEGVLKAAIKLDKELLPQPEGITFAPDGTLYISTEGKKGEGMILIFSQTKNDD
jgi:uncharacterized protein YjiK